MAAKVKVIEQPEGNSALTDAQLRAQPVPVSMDGVASVAGQAVQVAALGAPADPEATADGSMIGLLKRIRALLSTPLTVDGVFWPATQPVSLASVPTHAVTGPATNAELRATPLPVSLASVPSHAVTGPATNAELRATPLPVSVAAGAAFTIVSAKTAAPTANAVQCDTGQLPAGDYELEIQLVASDTAAVGKGLVVEHRNAANAANINVLGGCVAGETIDISIARITVALNERIRVIAGTAAGAASSMYISAIGRRLAA